MTDAYKNTLDFMRKEIEETLHKKTKKEWTVTCESEYMDFCFTAKVGTGLEEYAVRSASYGLRDLPNKSSIRLIVLRSVQMIISHYNQFVRRNKNDEENRGGVDNTDPEPHGLHD